MIHAELLQAAASARPQLMEKVASAISLSERLEPEYGAELVSEIRDITSYAMDKVAYEIPPNFSRVRGGPKDLALGVAGSVLAGLGGSLAVDLYDAARRTLTKSTNYRRIMEMNPNLPKEVEDPNKLKTHFNTLHKYAPEFTADPHLGGAVLRQMANLPPGAESNFISNLISARSNLINLKHRQFSPDSSAGQLLVPQYAENRLLTEVEKVKHPTLKAERDRIEALETSRHLEAARESAAEKAKGSVEKAQIEAERARIQAQEGEARRKFEIESRERQERLNRAFQKAKFEAEHKSRKELAQIQHENMLERDRLNSQNKRS